MRQCTARKGQAISAYVRIAVAEQEKPVHLVNLQQPRVVILYLVNMIPPEAMRLVLSVHFYVLCRLSGINNRLCDTARL